MFEQENMRPQLRKWEKKRVANTKYYNDDFISNKHLPTDNKIQIDL